MAPPRTAARKAAPGALLGALAGALAAAAVLHRGQRQAQGFEVPCQQAFLPRPGTQTRISVKPPRGRQSQMTQVQSTGFQTIDSSYNPTWLEIEEQPMTSLKWAHAQTLFAVAATLLYVFDIWRILHLTPPADVEAVFASVTFIGLYASRFHQVPDLEKHYQVSFYASMGWTVYAIASLLHAMAHGPHSALPAAATETLHTGASVIYLGSCTYFYLYHWGRQVRHILEGRFRPWFAVGLASLTFAHGLTVGHIFKMLEDPGWYPIVQKIYPDQWQWIADTRLLELYLTAAALFLVILHIRGVLTGTRNAAIVFLGTVIVPTAALFYETFFIKAVAWQHYFMVGPKHF